MILGIGTDLCEIRRIRETLERFGVRFLRRVFTENEQAKCDARPTRAESYARRWAAKEACSKALGTGVETGVSWREMEVVSEPEGRPTLRLTGAALRAAEAMTPAGAAPRVHLSLTDDGAYAQAFVVIEAVFAEAPIDAQNGAATDAPTDATSRRR